MTPNTTASTIMNTETIRAEIIAALLEVAPEVDAGTLHAEQNFRDQFDFDSIDFVNLILKLETRLAISIPQVDYPKLSSLAGAVRHVLSLAAAPESATSGQQKKE